MGIPAALRPRVLRDRELDRDWRGDASESAGRPPTATTGKADKNSLVYAVNTEPGKLDPQANSIIAGMCVEKQIFDTLIVKNPETGDFEPGLATEWEWVDTTHLKMTLREGVKWHDGSDFTSADVLYTIGRFADGAATASLYSAFDAANSTANGDYEVTIAFSYEFAPAINFPEPWPCLHRQRELCRDQRRQRP